MTGHTEYTERSVDLGGSAKRATDMEGSQVKDTVAKKVVGQGEYTIPVKVIPLCTSTNH